MRRFRKVMKGIALTLAVALTATAMPEHVQAYESETKAITDADFLKANGKNLRNASGTGDIVNLRGTNAGGYLLQEFWMTPTQSTANVKDEDRIYKVLTERFGKDKMLEIVDVYQDAYWTEQDFDNCAALGMNCIRLPFWWRNLVDENGVFYGYEENSVSGNNVSGSNLSSFSLTGKTDPYAAAFERMDWFIQEAGERGLYVIIDFHGAPGSQNGSDHSGVDGESQKEAKSEFFFGDNAEANQQLYYHIWEVIAERYKDNPVVAGYDLLNEPYCTYRYSSAKSATELHDILWNVYDKAYDVIRAKDPNHVIIMEATWNPEDLPNPVAYGWENVMYEYHNYLYDDYDNANGQQIANMETKLNAIGNADYNVPSYMGEFSYFNQPSAWDEGLELLTNAGINWTTWTYKTVNYYGMWGMYHHPAEFDNNKINLETASADEIIAFYSRMGESVENTDLTEVVSKWYQADTVANAMNPKYAEVENGSYYLIGNDTMKVLTGDADTSLIAATDSEMNDSDNQKFALVNNEDGTVSLKAGNGKYVSVDAGDKHLRATAETIGNSEKFRMLEVSSTLVAFKSVTTELYVSIVEDEENAAIAQSTNITGTESFQLYDMDKNLVGAAKLDTYSGWSRYEAEDETVATIHGGVKEAQNEGEGLVFSKGYAAGGMNSDTVLADVAEDWSNIKYVEFTVEAPKDGEYLLSLNYNGDDDKTILVKVNDGEQQVVDVPRKQNGTWNIVHEHVIKVNLQKGTNKIAISGTINGAGWMNLDCIDIINSPLGKNDVYTRYEAEDYFTNANVKSQSHFSGGKGVEDVNSDTALEKVAFNWANIKYVDFTIYAEEAGEYKVIWGYTGAGTNGMTALYRVNNGENQVITLNNEGGNWNVLSTYEFTVNLEEGFNSLMLSGTIIDKGHYANLDYIDVKLASVPDTPKAASGWTRYEGEQATIVGGGRESQDFYSMGSAASGLGTDAISVEEVAEDWSNIKYVSITVDAPRAGDYRLVMGYNGDDDKVGLIKVNDGASKVIDLPSVTAEHTWNLMHEKAVTVTLTEGENTISISGAVGGGWYNIDYIDVCNSPICVMDETKQTERYEAEYYNVKSANKPAVESQYMYSGPDKQGVGGMGSTCTYTDGMNILESKLNYTNFTIYAEQEGEYKVRLAFNGNGADMTGVYQVNDEASVTYALPNAGSSWDTISFADITVTLQKGFNQLLMAGTYSGDWLNFDYIDVTPVAEATEVTLDKTTLALKVNGTATLIANVLPAHAVNKTVTWESSNTKVATVDQTGKVTAVANGTATITATTANGKTATCEVTVTTDVSAITLNRTTLALKVKETGSLTATIAPSTASNKAVTWKSSNTKVATVDQTGKVTAVANGTATITVTAVNGKTATCKVTVTTDVTGVKLNKTSLALKVKGTSTLSATIAPSTASDKTVTWKSSNTKVATVDKTGKVTAVANGTATITATTVNGKTATCKVTVTTDATKVTLNKTSLALKVKGTSTLKATVTPSTASNKTVTWKSSNTKVATVDKNGKVTAKANGKATITVTTANGKTATCKVTVTTDATKITLNKTSATLLKGKKVTLKATVTPSTASNKTVKWKSSNTKVATVDKNGKVTAKGAGTATITATTANGKKATCKITVASVSLKSTKGTVKVGGTVKIAIKSKTPSKDTVKMYKSSNTKVATVDKNGKVKGIKKGTAKITVTMKSGATATYTVTVK